MKKFLIPTLIIVLLASIGFVISQRSDTKQVPQQSSEDTKTSVVDRINAPMDCSGKPLPELTEGPYYTDGSPERQSFREDSASGIPLILTGYVFDTDCNPIANAWIDFWQADGNGNYDNSGYILRGYQYTDADGFYSLETVVPGQYPGRTEHIHFKIKATENSPVVTSQLFFPDGKANTTDSIFDASLIVTMGKEVNGVNYATYNFVVEKD